MTRARIHVSPEGNLATADCREVSGRAFFDALFPGPSREERYAAQLATVIRLIEVGADLSGYPPLMVADARKLMAERAHCPGCGRMTDLDDNGECADCSAMPELRRNGTGGWL